MRIGHALPGVPLRGDPRLLTAAASRQEASVSHLLEEFVERGSVVVMEPICKLVCVEHVRRVSLSTDSYSIVWLIGIWVEENESDAKLKAQRLQSALVFL